MPDFVNIHFENFFDRLAVQKAVKDTAKAGLAKAGAYVRQRAKTKIRKRKKISSPGSPPSSHTGLLKNRIFFAYDPDTQSVVVGPDLLRSAKRGGRETAPELLEKGGVTKSWRTGKPVFYQARPFMQPSLQEESPNFPQYFAR